MAITRIIRYIIYLLLHKLLKNVECDPKIFYDSTTVLFRYFTLSNFLVGREGKVSIHYFFQSIDSAEPVATFFANVLAANKLLLLIYEGGIVTLLFTFNFYYFISYYVY